MIFEDGRVQSEPDEGEAKQANADIPQAAIRDDPEEPDQGETFERPAERDPFAIELNREYQRNEEERRRALPRQTGIASRGIRLALSDEKPNGNGVGNNENSRSEAVIQRGKRVPDGVVNQHELERTGQGADRPWQGSPFFRGE